MRADTLKQVEPDRGVAFVLRPYCLTDAELGGLPAALASASTPVRAWVRYPATADRVHGLALAWTPRAVYLEWEGSGTHRTRVWASAVESATASQTASNLPPQRQQVNVATIRDTEPLVALINAQLAQSGAEFVTSMAQPAGPFGAVVFGSIDDHAVRLEFFIEPATTMCAMHLFDMTTKKVFVERVAAPTFEKAIEGYPWAAAIDMLGNT
ncbi:hypothetical protein [Cryobacterium sp. TMT1-66-1]|uniref:hypothetical protein n=1 Tax=Cryobacterium sp. TMT1-66-1 TaxID=1259242 RepID=UPI001069FC36|nr:hypothetical protein [Cryobacterium sp. TMT1-66-1]TFD06316.1 hypothetical protein E3T29_10635 [Cryobacterium sp. TMT1-66-1]